MLAFRLALRNLLGAGLRTWLNVIVLSFSFIIIIWTKGLLEGWDRQARNDMISWEVGGGQYWHGEYDPYDPFTLTDSHGPVPEALKPELADGKVGSCSHQPGFSLPERNDACGAYQGNPAPAEVN
jgi:hypothetical protein